MTVFMKNGEGDIYGGPSREAIIAEMQQDNNDLDVSQVIEVPGDSVVGLTDEDENPTDEFSTLLEACGDCSDALMVATENC